MYYEVVNCEEVQLIIEGEMLTGDISHVIYIPSIEKWNDSHPSWAKGRRDVIIDRMKSDFPESENEYFYEKT